jgi:hypothetical protein
MKKITTLALTILFLFGVISQSVAQNAPVDFETGGQGADWTWIMDQNADNPALNIIANPDISGANTSAMVAEFTARQTGMDWALVISDNIGQFTFDATNSTVKLMVWKPVISDVGVKFEGDGGVAWEVKVPNTVTNQWEELTFDFSSQNGVTFNKLVIIPDFASRAQDNTLYFDNMTFSAGNVVTPALNAPVDFEPGGHGADWTWIVDQNADNPPLNIIANPDISGANTSATVAEFTARQTGMDWALVISDNIGQFTFDATNSTVKLMVWKPVISDVGVKFEGDGGVAWEVKVPNTVTNQWEELTFDFSSQEGVTFNKLVIIPDFASRAQDNTLYFDNLAFTAGDVVEPVLNAPVDFEDGGHGADWTWIVDQNADNPPLNIIANPDVSGANTSATVAEFTARQTGMDWALVISDNIGQFTFDATNSTVKFMVWKPIISDVGVKFEGPGGVAWEVKVPNTVTNQWEELTFDFSSQEGVTFNKLVIIPDFASRAQDNTLYFDNLAFTAGDVVEPVLNAPVDFEDGGHGADWTWIVDQNADNPPLNIISNPDKQGANTSETVAEFTARQNGMDWALVISDDIGHFTFDATNSTVKLMVWKPIISDVGVKFEGPGGAAWEVKVPNTITNAWEELTFDFKSQEGVTFNKLVLIPDFASRDQDNTLYFDNLTFSDGTTTDVNESSDLLPSQYVLEQNYPNPFNPSTRIKFAIPESNKVTVKVLNILGEEVAILVDGFRNAGTYEVSFDASNLASGTYLYSITSGEYTTVKKMMLIK